MEATNSSAATPPEVDRAAPALAASLPTAQTAFAKRVVLLGASNLTNGLATILQIGRAWWGGPLEVFAALGHGRSYIQESDILLRRLPAIRDANLWRAWDTSPDRPTVALITDLGNDLAHVESVDELVNGIGTVLERLAPRTERLVITAAPVGCLEAISEWWYVTLRRCMFPESTLPLCGAIERAQAMNKQVARVAREHGAVLVEPELCWYEMDPIHIVPRQWQSAWETMLGPLCPESERQLDCRSPGWSKWLWTQSLLPEEWAIFRQAFSNEQPAGTLRDGTAIHLY